MKNMEAGVRDEIRSNRADIHKLGARVARIEGKFDLVTDALNLHPQPAKKAH